MKKKLIQQPEIQVVKLQSKDVICTSESGDASMSKAFGKPNEAYQKVTPDMSTWYLEQQK